MRKFIFILLILIAPICLCGCSTIGELRTKDIEKKDIEEYSSFVVVDRFEDTYGCFYTILVNVQTRVMYMRCQCGYSGSIIVLLDENGNPQIYDGEL